MAHAHFKVQHRNPNVKDGACLCNQHGKMVDCKPPYIVFYASDMWNPRAPHPVMCASCVATAVRRLAEVAGPEGVIEASVAEPVALPELEPVPALGKAAKRKLSRAEADAMTLAAVPPPVVPESTPLAPLLPDPDGE